MFFVHHVLQINLDKKRTETIYSNKQYKIELCDVFQLFLMTFETIFDSIYKDYINTALDYLKLHCPILKRRLTKRD